MQGSYGDSVERFRGGKKRNTEQSRINKADKDLRMNRRNRHQNTD